MSFTLLVLTLVFGIAHATEMGGVPCHRFLTGDSVARVAPVYSLEQSGRANQVVFTLFREEPGNLDPDAVGELTAKVLGPGALKIFDYDSDGGDLEHAHLNILFRRVLASAPGLEEIHHEMLAFEMGTAGKDLRTFLDGLNANQTPGAAFRTTDFYRRLARLGFSELRELSFKFVGDSLAVHVILGRAP